MSRSAGSGSRKRVPGTLERVCAGERVVLRRGRKVVAAVVPIEDLRLLQRLEDEEDILDARTALREARRKGTIPWEKVKAELNLG